MFLVVFFLVIASFAESTPLILKYDSPGSYWESQNLPMGNGYIGVSVLGQVGSESLIMNEKTLWSGFLRFWYIYINRI
jgi:alpha-L-fucosidase 2